MGIKRKLKYHPEHVLYRHFEHMDIHQLQKCLIAADSREEKAFYRTLINLKLQLEQERIVEEILV